MFHCKILISILFVYLFILFFIFGRGDLKPFHCKQSKVFAFTEIIIALYMYWEMWVKWRFQNYMYTQNES